MCSFPEAVGSPHSVSGQLAEADSFLLCSLEPMFTKSWNGPDRAGFAPDLLVDLALAAETTALVLVCVRLIPAFSPDMVVLATFSRLLRTVLAVTNSSTST